MQRGRLRGDPLAAVVLIALVMAPELWNRSRRMRVHFNGAPAAPADSTFLPRDAPAPVWDGGDGRVDEKKKMETQRECFDLMCRYKISGWRDLIGAFDAYHLPADGEPRAGTGREDFERDRRMLYFCATNSMYCK